MAIRVTITYVRPDTSTDWYTISDEHNTYVQTNFVSNGKMIQDSTTTSADGLTRTFVHRYPNDSDRNDWMNPSLHATIKTHNETAAAYCAANGISRTMVAESI